MKYELTEETINEILANLANQPYFKVANIISQIQTQLQTQQEKKE